jgi:hypothetical protein
MQTIFYIYSLQRILDVWEASRAALQSLGFVVTVGGVHSPGSTASSDEASSIDCCVSDKIFPSSNTYQLHITSNLVGI